MQIQNTTRDVAYNFVVLYRSIHTRRAALIHFTSFQIGGIIGFLNWPICKFKVSYWSGFLKKNTSYKLLTMYMFNTEAKCGFFGSWQNSPLCQPAISESVLHLILVQPQDAFICIAYICILGFDHIYCKKNTYMNKQHVVRTGFSSFFFSFFL